MSSRILAATQAMARYQLKPILLCPSACGVALCEFFSSRTIIARRIPYSASICRQSASCRTATGSGFQLSPAYSASICCQSASCAMPPGSSRRFNDICVRWRVDVVECLNHRSEGKAVCAPYLYTITIIVRIYGSVNCILISKELRSNLLTISHLFPHGSIRPSTRSPHGECLSCCHSAHRSAAMCAYLLHRE
jgi:hypothetical protein